MSQSDHLTETELRQRLAEVEAILAALRSSKADTLIGDAGPLLLQRKSAVEEREHQQRQAERIAREWTTTFDAVQDAIWILDLDQRVVRTNAAAEKAFGCPLAEMIGRRCFDIAHHTDRPISGCPFCSMRASRQRESFEMRLGERCFLVTTDPLMDEGNNLIGAVHIARDITGQKHAEEKIRESEETYRNLFQNAQVGLYRTRISDGKILESNEQLARMFGYDSREEFIAEFATTSSYVDPGTRERMLREIRENGTIQNFEARFYRKDGSIFWARYSARIYPDKGWIEGVAENITERKRAEEALIENKRRLATLLANLPGMAYRCQNRPDWPMEFVSDGCAGLTGWPASALLENRPAYGELIVEADRQLVWDAVQEALAARRPFEMTYRIQTADGQLRWVWERGYGVFAPDGSLLYLEGFITDITTRVQAEAALRESEARCRRLFENSLVGIYRTTPDGRILLANPTLVKMLRYPSFEALAQVNLEKTGFHPQYPRRLFKETIERDGVVRGLESAWTCADGTTVYVRESAQAVRGPDGRIAYYEGVVEDVTEQRRLEERLHHASKMEAIGRLAGGVAHDFNNILSVVIMQTDLMAMEEGLSNTAKEGLRQIRAAAERAANLTRQMLMFSRRQAMQPRDLDLNDTVTNLTKMLQRIIGEDVHLELRLYPTPLLTRADVGMLDQVLMNLAVNARDAMPMGGRLIIETTAREFTPAEAATLPDVQPGRYVGLRVSDTGCGIPPEILPHIYEPFFTTKEPGKGTGLGLATVFGIVKQHNGCIQITSEPGRGTTFEIYLPALPETAVAETMKVETSPSPRGGTETILLVEDDPAVRVLTRTTLQRHGYRVLEAADGITALELWQTHRDAVALLLTDMVMPGGLNGRELARQLRADRPELKVIFTSGYSPELAEGMFSHQEGEAFLQKPCEATHLLETVRRCLDAPSAPPSH